MKNAGYEGPPDGDYVAYVDKLLRASPEYRRTQQSVGQAVMRAEHSPGSAGEISISELKAKFERVKQQTLAAQAALGGPGGPGRAGLPAGSAKGSVGSGLSHPQAGTQSSQNSAQKASSAQRRGQAIASGQTRPATAISTSGNTDDEGFLAKKGGGLGWFLIVAGVVVAQSFTVLGWILILLGALVYFLRFMSKLGSS